MERTIDLAVLSRRMWAHRRAIGLFVGITTVVTAIVVWSLPPWYMATATLLPPSEEDSSFGIARMFRGVAVPGIRIPTQTSPAEIFLAVLGSQRVRKEIVTRFGYQKIYKTKLMETATKELRSHSKFKLTDSGTIEMSFEDTNPKRAADVLAAYVELLDRFNREVRTTKGRRTRLFVESRLSENRVELAKTEQALADYQTKHKTAIITPEMSTAAEEAARIYAQRTALEVRLGVVSGYSREGSQEVQQIQAQIAQIDRQLRALPETGLELARLLRDVKKYEQIYILLTAQYEEARIDEARDVVTVDMLDPPVPPERKTRPHRLVTTAVAFLLSLGAGLAYGMFQEEKQPEAVPASAVR